MPASQAFTILALFSTLVPTFSSAPLGIQTAGEAIVAVRRLQRMLDLDQDTTKNNEVLKDVQVKAVLLNNCSFSWEKKAKAATANGTGTNPPNIELDALGENVLLKNITFSVCKGEFVTIHGPVGSGKSSLLYAILGEMQCLKGDSFVQRDIACAPQQPWIFKEVPKRSCTRIIKLIEERKRKPAIEVESRTEVYSHESLT